MAGSNLIVLFVVILVVGFILFLFHSSGVLQGGRVFLKNIRKKIDEITNAKDVEAINGPVIYYRAENEKKYQSVTVNKRKFTIGRNQESDLVFNSKQIEEKHIVICKQYKENRVYYELINYSKVNPVEYYNEKEQTYEFLRYKEGLELNVRECFYMGNIKLIVKMPDISHKPTETEGLGILGSRQKDSCQKENSQKGSGFQEEKRVVSERIVRKNEIDI